MIVAFARKIRSSLASEYLLPLLLLTGASFSCVLILLFYGASVQDQMQLEREEKALQNVVKSASLLVRHDLQDYAKWDEAVRHIDQRVDPAWIEDNVVAYLGGTQGYNEIFVLDGEDRVVYSWKDSRFDTRVAQRRLGRDFMDSLALVRRIPQDGAPIVSGFSRANGQIYLFATAAIVPLTSKVSLSGPRPKLLVIARIVDFDWLTQFADDLPVSVVRLSRSRDGTEQQNVAIRGLNGAPLGWIGWEPFRPGTLLRQRLAPGVVFFMLIGAMAAVLILRRGKRAVEDLQQSERRARHLSDHDMLTGLPNRRALMARMAVAVSGGTRLTLLLMDLDGFKNANDVYGHSAGDLLLQNAAARIRNLARDVTVARLGGDEFAVLLPSEARVSATELCVAILHAFREPLRIGAYKIRLGISIGYAVSDPERTDRESELLRRADVAMYAAKAAGRNCFRAYEPELDDSHRLRVQMENDLRLAVEEGRISVQYQPIVDAATFEVVAVEALARWWDPIHGNVPPDVFIPIAEMSGLITGLGRHVLLTACAAMRDSKFDLAVNLSPAQFWDGELLREVQAILQETGFPPERLELEITESLMLRQPQGACEIIDGLRALGVRFALDDFGTGFAGIAYLRQLHLDRLKIDKAFITAIESERRAQDMLVSITGLARACNLDVCAEGIETAEQARIALMSGCNRLQGWLFGRPQDAEHLLAFSSDTASRVA